MPAPASQGTQLSFIKAFQPKRTDFLPAPPTYYSHQGHFAHLIDVVSNRLGEHLTVMSNTNLGEHLRCECMGLQHAAYTCSQSKLAVVQRPGMWVG